MSVAQLPDTPVALWDQKGEEIAFFFFFFALNDY